jgi:hypothetical protein
MHCQYQRYGFIEVHDRRLCIDVNVLIRSLTPTAAQTPMEPMVLARGDDFLAFEDLTRAGICHKN